MCEKTVGKPQTNTPLCTPGGRRSKITVKLIIGEQVVKV
jgi:hypothetical protein